MKKFLHSLLFMCLGIFLGVSISAQTWSDVILRENGDTLVVKGYLASNAYNTIPIAVNGDTTASGERNNPNRIYKTIPGELYINTEPGRLDADVRIVADPAPAGIMPPLHIKSLKDDGSWAKTFYYVYGDLYMENQYICLTSTSDDQQDREFLRAYTTGQTIEMNNCVLELSDWTHFLAQVKGVILKYRNCKFLNVGHEATLEKGVTTVIWPAPQDTIIVENCTFLNGLSLILGLNNTAPDYVYFNHNTIVNSAQGPLHFHSAAEAIVTNNLFINTNMIPDYPEYYPLLDDDDHMPKGIINIDTLEDSWRSDYWNVTDYPFADEHDRKVLFDRNNAWWDARLAGMMQNRMNQERPIPESKCPGGCQWSSQMIVMNDRTKAFFDDDANYPYYTLGTTLNIEPDFANNKDLVQEWIDWVVSNTDPVTPGGGNLMPWWRTNDKTNIFIPDWPMLADLSYSDATLKSAGYYGLPLGDLNWFPDAKAVWEGKGEYEALNAALQAGEFPVGINENIKINELKFSVYPNPFSNAANVEYELNSNENVKLNLYNLVGEKVRSIDLGYQRSGNHQVTIDKGDLKPGVYILQIKTDYNAGTSIKLTVN
jgi:hypothetical protein